MCFSDKSILCLLPQHPQSILEDFQSKIRLLNLIINFVGEIITTINEFYIDKVFDNFDPQVGENQCQSRAYFILRIAHSVSTNDHQFILDQVNKFKEIEKSTISCLNNLHSQNELRSIKNKNQLFMPEKLLDFLESHNLIFDISFEIYFLMQARFLTKFCKKNLVSKPIGIDYRKIISSFNISKNSADRIINLFQKNLSEISCQFITNLMDELPSSIANDHPMMVNFQKDHLGRTVLPCYDMTRIIIDHILMNARYHIQVEIYNIKSGTTSKILFKSNKIANDFEICDSNRISNLPVLVISGTANFENEMNHIDQLLEVGLKNVILANVANHPAFSCKILNMQFDSEIASHEIHKMKSLGKIMGCCLDNQSLFLIQHFYVK